MTTEPKPAVMILAELSAAIRDEIIPRRWESLAKGLGVLPSADYSDAEFHLRALYRILAANVEVR